MEMDHSQHSQGTLSAKQALGETDITSQKASEIFEAWPILLGVTPSAAADTSVPADDGWKKLPRHKDEDQVQLDVNRAFIYYPNDQSTAQIDQRKTELSNLIVEVLRRYPYLCYFQGYHDICQVFLLVLGPAHSPPAVARLSILRIRDFMLPTLGPTTSQLRLLPDILAKADPELRQHIAGVEPFYALAGTLTMYAHNIEGYRDIARMFDVFLAREPVFSIYVFAQIVLNRREEILEVDDSDILQVILSKVPSNLDLDALIAQAASLFSRYPPESLYSWRYISSSSALKTARDVEAFSKQTTDDGHVYFIRQIKDIRWLETQDKIKRTVWIYRRPVRAIGIAIAVGMLAMYLRRHPATVHSILSRVAR
ncbi:hypothetical protein S7711_00719 [Stachybotrys chartarum IBT 7711]|uniref:Rab-GAP TBC domain-containing protein n=1 Tax=Stachybotrys chartarum (strain CBS 109288 / IBT 7711) TaxID=1280523 RepID=A0A084AZZ4_STACB|nr:hypothetical protein S7711_00719 [Stachybotrys chartarum IBT 7711]